MRALILSTLLATLFVSLPGATQPPRTAIQIDPASLIRGWYRQFLDRDPDLYGMQSWLELLRRGQPPEAILSGILGSEEYYLRAGGTPEGFIHALLVDVTGREPDPPEVREWLHQMHGQDRNAIALQVLRRHAQAWQPPVDGTQHDFLAPIRERTDDLTTAIENLQEDIIVELGGQRERGLYQQADEVLGHLRHFRRSLRSGVSREHLYRDFERLDKNLHALLESVRALDRNRPALQRAALRVRRADQRLHYALSLGDSSEPRRREVLLRLVIALLDEARELQRTARYALGDRLGRLQDDLRDFVDAAEHYHRAIERGADLDHLRRDFATLERTWLAVTQEINRLPPISGNIYLRRRAQRVDTLYGDLAQQLGRQGSRPRIIISLDRAR